VGIEEEAGTGMIGSGPGGIIVTVEGFTLGLLLARIHLLGVIVTQVSMGLLEPGIDWE